jgi:chromosome segregation ATPase
VRLAIDRATEELQRRLRASDSEVIIANDRIKSLEKTQRELANELMSATRLIDEVGNPADLKRQLTALEDRHVDALEMMGETSEENEELKERTAALKSMVDALTEKVAALEAARAEASS